MATLICRLRHSSPMIYYPPERKLRLRELKNDPPPSTIGATLFFTKLSDVTSHQKTGFSLTILTSSGFGGPFLPSGPIWKPKYINITVKLQNGLCKGSVFWRGQLLLCWKTGFQTSFMVAPYNGEERKGLLYIHNPSFCALHFHLRKFTIFFFFLTFERASKGPVTGHTFEATHFFVIFHISHSINTVFVQRI